MITSPLTKSLFRIPCPSLAKIESRNTRYYHNIKRCIVAHRGRKSSPLQPLQVYHWRKKVENTVSFCPFFFYYILTGIIGFFFCLWRSSSFENYLLKISYIIYIYTYRIICVFRPRWPPPPYTTYILLSRIIRSSYNTYLKIYTRTVNPPDQWPMYGNGWKMD